MKKLFVVKKYVMADDAAQAIRLEKRSRVYDVWLDEDWAKALKEQPREKKGKIGF